MSGTWRGVPEPPPRKIGGADWVRIVVRGLPIIVFLALGFPLLLILRLPERFFCGQRRPVTPFITQAVCIQTCRALGLRRDVRGRPMEGPGAYVSNHVSWLDIFVLNACKRVYFVAKTDVRGWPGVGWLARGTGTVFVERRREDAKAQALLIEDRLRLGHRLMLFPEGTSSDGQRVLAFKSSLFESFFAESLRDTLRIQPVSLRYHPPVGEDPSFYGWWGDMDFGAGLLAVLAAPRQGSVEITYHPPLRVADFADRKAMAVALEAAVRSSFAATV